MVNYGRQVVDSIFEGNTINLHMKLYLLTLWCALLLFSPLQVVGRIEQNLEFNSRTYVGRCCSFSPDESRAQVRDWENLFLMISTERAEADTDSLN